MEYNESIEKNITEIIISEKDKYDLQSNKDLNSYFDIVNIILDNTKNFIYEDEQSYIAINETVEYVYKFLSEINEQYGKKFIDSIKNDEIIFCSKFNYNNTINDPQFYNSRKILIPIENTIQDSVKLLHQYIHHLTYNKKKLNNLDYNKFKNTPTISSEFIFENNNKNIKGIYSIGTNRLKTLRDDAYETKIKLLLLKETLYNQKFSINKFLEGANDEKRNLALRIINEIYTNGEINFINKYSKILGLVHSFNFIYDTKEINETINLLNENPFLFNKKFNYNTSEIYNGLDKNLLVNMNNNFSNKIQDRNIAILSKKFF